LKKLLKKIFLRLFDPVAFRLGYKKIESIKPQAIPEITEKYSKNNLLDRFYTLLKSLDFNPKHIVDVGANRGTWTREALKYFPDCQFTLFEPQAEMKESIKDILASNPNVSFNAMGAGKQKGSFNFTIVDRDDSCSFRFTEEEAANRGFKQIEIPVITLNEFIPERKLTVPDIIKIDAEGLDLDVLEGASDFFGFTEIFMVEAGVMAKNIKNSAAAVTQYMNENGYRLFDITDMNRTMKHQALWLVEFVFVKKSGKIDNSICSYN
jgi:FkbM family methyltransferase